MSEAPTGLRERTRRAVQVELTTVAQDLFIENGYEATTVEQIATAAGMSKRSFFRYFSSKEDLVIGKYEALGDQLSTTLRERPADEPVWQSLRRVFDDVIRYIDDDTARQRADALQRIVDTTPALTAGYLEKQSRLQKLLTAGVAERLGRAADDPRPEALVGAAFACLRAAQSVWLASDRSRSFAELLDSTMDGLRPSV